MQKVNIFVLKHILFTGDTMYIAFILTTISALSTLLGIIPIFIKIKDKNKLISISCSFASGVMTSISIISLIPESINYLSNKYTSYILIIVAFISMFLGIITSYYLDKYIDKVSTGSNLYKVGILSMIVIILHNIPEGIITFITSNQNILLGLSICISIAIHNIPEGISIAIPIYYATNSKFKSIIYTFISSLGELLGAIITYLFLSNYITDTILGIILSFTAGIMLSISLTRMYRTSYNYNHKLARLFFIIGIIFMIVSLRLETLIS